MSTQPRPLSKAAAAALAEIEKGGSGTLKILRDLYKEGYSLGYDDGFVDGENSETERLR